MDDSSGAGRWVATGSGAAAGLLVLSVVGVYAYGLAQPAHRVVEARAVLAGVSPEDVWAVVGAPERRPEWRPAVERIARIDERDGAPVYRELDADGDRFDFVVTTSEAPRRLVLEVAAPEQIGFVGGWTWALEPVPAGTAVTVTEDGTIDNPLWRGLYALRASPWDTVTGELAMLSAHLGAPLQETSQTTRP
jgi:uncharacterized protein YndB with AHSA1/START domain